MAGRYFGIPFATSGDKVVVPDATQPDGSVSFTQGFGFDYERPNTDPAYKPVPRDGTNGIFHDITEALGIAQRQGVSDWTVDAQPYPINALVRHTDKVWRSLVANNNVTPVEGANWTEVGALSIATTAEAIALTDDQRALTPAKLAAALMGGNAQAATPPQFDNDTSLATTAFVKRSGLEMNAFRSYNSGGAIPVSDVGSPIQLAQATSQTYTVPLASACPSGSVLYFTNTGGAAALIARSGSDTFAVGNGSNTGITVLVGEQLMLVSNGADVWFAIGGSAALIYSSGFNNLKATNGFQFLPSGLIIQWGTITGITTSDVVITFPIAFPTNTVHVGIQARGDINAPVSNKEVNAPPKTIATTSFTLMAGPDGGYYGGVFLWFAIGY